MKKNLIKKSIQQNLDKDHDDTVLNALSGVNIPPKPHKQKDFIKYITKETVEEKPIIAPDAEKVLELVESKPIVLIVEKICRTS